MFDFEWTGKSYADHNSNDHARGVAAAEAFFNANPINPADAYAENGFIWAAAEFVAVSALAEGWDSIPENVSLIWRPQ